MKELVQQALPHADAIVASPEGRRQATLYIAENFEHIPPELIVHLMRGAAACDAVHPFVEYARANGWQLDAKRIECPVRVVWGTADRLLEYPGAAARYRDDWLPTADWVELDGIGHCIQLDVPLEASELIAGFTAR